VLVGWALDIAPLKSILPGLASMKSNSALLFIFCGISLWMQIEGYPRRIAQAFALIVISIGLLTLVEYLFNSNFGIDQLLFQDMAAGVLHPGRMAPSSATAFILMGCALLLAGNPAKSVLKDSLVLITLAITGLAIIGYLYGVSSLYQISAYASMALHTALSFILLSLAFLFAWPQRGLMGTIMADTAGGKILRRFLPAVILFPVVLGWIRLLGQHAGLYDTAFGLALMVTSLITTLIILIWFNAKELTNIDIKREQTNAQLLERELKLATLFEILPVGISIMDEERKVTYTNPALKKILDISEEGLLKGAYRNRKYLRTDGTLMPLDDLASMRAFKEKREIEGVETGVVKEDGSIIWTAVSAVPVDFPDWKVVLVTTDITERKKVEATKSHLAAIVESSNDAIISKDLHSTVTSWNLGAQMIFGYTADEMIGQPILRLIPPEHMDEEDMILKQIAQGNYVPEFETMRLTKDGRQIHVSVSVSPIKDLTGKIVGASKVARDISQRKQVEEALHANERRLHLASTAGGVGIWDWDLIKDELHWDDSMYSLYGMDKKDFLGAYQAWTSTLHPEDREFTEREIQAALRGEREYSPEFRIVRPDGVVRVMKATAQTIRDESGKALRMIGTNIDITELKLVESEILKLNADLEEKVIERTTELAKANEQLLQLSHVDELTGLYNRRGFLLHAEQQLLLARRMKRNLLIFYADLDNLKQINDSRGHLAGDEAIFMAARALHKTFRSSDIKARIGGDEFIVLAVQADEHFVEPLLARLRERLGESNLAMSVGVITFDAQNEISIDDLIARADAAMYAEKQLKPNRNTI